MSDLILLRHGETTGKSSVRFYGSTDIELSEFGIEQMRCAGRVLENELFGTVYTSPLKRSRHSADIVMNGREPEPVVVEEFREIDFGKWEGLSHDEIAERDPQGYRAWKQNGLLFSRFPGGESKAEFYRRIAMAANKVFNHNEQPALAVLHKGVIRGIIAALLDIQPLELTGHPIELGSIHRLSRFPGGWKLISTNETSHLGEFRIEHS